MSEPRHFTLDEANAYVPTLQRGFELILRLRAQLRGAGAELERLGESADERALRREGGTPEVQAARARTRGLFEALTDELRRLEELGVQVKDLDIGLCDFVARRDGRDVYLCWRLGEKAILFWHELGTGFPGRQPIDGGFQTGTP